MKWLESERMTFMLRVLITISLIQLIFIGSGFFFSHYYFDLVDGMQLMAHLSFFVSGICLIEALLRHVKHFRNRHLLHVSFGLAVISELSLFIKQLL
jgi:Na+/melibiose symporter-like transporter